MRDRTVIEQRASLPSISGHTAVTNSSKVPRSSHLHLTRLLFSAHICVLAFQTLPVDVSAAGHHVFRIRGQHTHGKACPHR